MTTDTKDMEPETEAVKPHKPSKRGIIYLSTIPPYMNVTKIREVMSKFGKVGRVFLQLANKDPKTGEFKTKKRKTSKKFTEGWVEFEKKCVAKRVARMLNNTQVDTRKKSKQYDSMWNMKYLSRFKWTHLHERLAYEKASREKKLRADIELAKKTANYFSGNIGKKKKDSELVNKEYENLKEMAKDAEMDDGDSSKNPKGLASLFA